MFVENVGDLVCPAGFDLGQNRNVVLLSVTEGDDKPAQYPVTFRGADLVLVSKIDLAPVTEDFDQRRVERAVRELANAAPVIALSGRKATNSEPWFGDQKARRAPAFRPGVQTTSRSFAAAARFKLQYSTTAAAAAAYPYGSKMTNWNNSIQDRDRVADLTRR